MVLRTLVLCGLVGSGWCCIGRAAESPLLAANTYTNPVFARSMPDPSVIRHGEYYYAFGTTGAGRLRDGRAFKVLRSADLVHWEERGGALAVPASDIRLNYWAPDVAVHAGRFYLYYSMGRPDQEKFDLRVGTSAAPEGPYVGRTDLFVYHAWDAAMKVRQMCIDRLEWTPEGPRCIPTTTPQPLP